MIPENIRKLADKVREERYGKDVRESIAESMEETGETAQYAKDLSDETQGRFEEQIQNMTLEDPSSAEIVDARGNHNLLKDRLNSVDQDLAQKLAYDVSADTESAPLGSELVDSTGWTVPTGWTGDFASGFTNTVGNVNALTRTMSATGTKIFQVAFRIESPTPAGVPNASTDFKVTIGNSEPFVTYQGGGNFNYTFGIQSVSDGDLKFIPGDTFDGTIKNVSVKEIIGSIKPNLEIKDELDNNVMEFRGTKSSLQNVFIGKSSGGSNTSGRENVSLGDLSLSRNTTGYWNNAIGKQAMEFNTTGSRNIAMGFYALKENVSGDRNIAIGTYTLQRNKTGRQNIALGADCLWVNTTGSRNIAMGMGTMGENTEGNENIAIGHVALEHNTTGNKNIAIGYNAMQRSSESSHNIAIGTEAMKNNTAEINVAIGYASMARNTSGFSNVAIGSSALYYNETGYESTVIGHQAGYRTTGRRNTIVGAWAGYSLTDGINNTLIGSSVGKNMTSGSGNIMIGYNIEEWSNTLSNQLNIGDVIRGSVTRKQLTIGTEITVPTARLHLPPVTTDDGSAPLKLETGTLMTTPEPGAIEYANNKLYFTIGNGERKEIAFV